MNIQQFVGGYKNHPVLFIGTGISLRYLQNSFTWDGLLRHVARELFGNDERYLDIKALHDLQDGRFDYPSVGGSLEQQFNDALGNDRNGKFQAINDQFYALMNEGKNASRFKLFISELLREVATKPEMENEIAELKRTRKNIGSIITTNYDRFIEGLFEFEPLIGNDILLSNPYGSVYKIHGCVSDPLKIIVTSNDYRKFDERYELIRAQLLSIFIHNPIIFLGYKVGDQNIKDLLRTIFTYVEPNSDTAQKIRQNFLLVEYDEGSDSQEITDHDIELPGFSTIRINKIKTDNYAAIYRELGALALPISAMDVRKVQSIVKEIYAGGNVGVKITEDLDSLSNADKILAIGSSKTIQYHYQTATETMANYFAVIEEANSHVIGLIDKYKIQTSQFFPMYGFAKINPRVALAENLKSQQRLKLQQADASVPQRSKTRYSSIDEILQDDSLPVSARANAIFFNFREGRIQLDDLEKYLINHPDKSKTEYRKLLCAYDFAKYDEDR
ncbi:SIR2 family protein [Pseudacidovorax intermedius]|uniref:SIR2 family protein n=1 Tax=Pseudacidovorax intermedius TaxID=433924 RepID=UPI00034633FB|nr:SIR2 family protein [Pseudacidovorax intermedius]